MNDILLNQADNARPDSLATRLRKKRFLLFLNLLNSITKNKIEILDIGGTVEFWKNTGLLSEGQMANIHITVLNLKPQYSEYEFIVTVTGDARDLSIFKDKQFDIIFSNSVIEHLGTYNNQKHMASEVRRVGVRYFIQTPSRYFPIEPHFLFPFFQFLPLACKIFLLRYFNLGWYSKLSEKEKAAEAAKKIRLLSLKELKELFPDSEIYKEKFFGLTKSFIAYKFG